MIMKVRSLCSLITSLAILGAGSCFLAGVAKAETKTAESGNVRAEVSFQPNPIKGRCAQNPQLRLFRSDQIVLNQNIPTEEIFYCWLEDLQVRDLDKDNEPEIILDIYSGGPHCCTSSMIYRYDVKIKEYTAITHPWFHNFGPKIDDKIQDIDKDGNVEFVNYDSRFAYKFSPFSYSRFPLQIWQYHQGKMIDVTRRYPQQVKNHAYQLWQEYITIKNQFEGDATSAEKAILAAYLADKFLLGEGEDGERRVQETYKESDRTQFFTELRKFLGETGYIVFISDPNQQNTAGRSQNIAQPPQSQLLTWREFVERGGRRFIQVDYDLPSEFRNGYVYINTGADNNTAYILKQGLSGYPPKLNAITQIDYAVGDRYVKSGNAIKFNWGGGAVYYQRHGRDTEVRFSEKSGQGCLRLTCLEAPFMTNQQITIILRSERAIGQTTTVGSPSPSQQTQTGRSLLLQEQGVLASGDSVLPSDNSLYDEYTFEGVAGQSVTLTVESSDFDTYVAVFSPDGKLLIENDDINQSSKNSGLTVTIPSNGTYRVIVNGYDNNSRGGYAVSVSTPNQQTVTGQSPSPNQQTATGTIQPVIQTFSSVKSLGMAQFLRGTTELKSAQETLQKAARGEYDTITNGQKTDFIEDILEDIPEIRPVDCKSFGFSCESTEITYADYLNLKLKVYLQVGVFKNGMKVYDEIPKYQNRLFQDQRYGGLNVGQNLTSEWDKRWNNVKEQQRLKDKQANLPITERLGVVMEQTIQDTANFSGELFKTSTKVAATLAQIKDLAETITSLRSINQDNLNRIAGGPKYYFAVEEILKDSGKALQSFDTDKINELALKGAQETIELINAQDRKVAGSANVIKIYSAAKDIIDKNNLLRQPQATNALDDFDKFYIAATMYSKAVEVIIGGLSIPFSEAKVVDTLLKKADAVNTVLLDALEFTYKDSVRRQYVRLQYAYNRNQIQVVGLSSFIDYAAEEVGQYLLKARPDIVTRRPDGTIAVSVDGVVYPP